MALRFTVLASGSSGNATLVQANDFGVLIDVGLGPRQFATRLREVGSSWSSVDAVLLTHTHSDHWKDRTFAYLQRAGIPLYCHPDHHPVLLAYSPAFSNLLAAGLVRPFEAWQRLLLAPGLHCQPLPVRHDSGATFGFRLDGAPDLFGRAPALAYAADLGTWDAPLAEQLADVDLLALEFNHDVSLERSSGRAPRLVARVLGDEGHLSNDQASALVADVLRRSPGRLRHLVQLHLSRDCNRRSLAREAARRALDGTCPEVRLHTAHQHVPGSPLLLSAEEAPRRRQGATRRPLSSLPAEPWLPGLEPTG